MNTLDTIKTRRSIRKYQDRIPTDAELKTIAEAGTYAATGMNKQAPIILVVKSREVRDRLSKLNASVMGADGDPFYGAPVVMVVLADRKVPTYIYDGSLVMGNMMLAAKELGLGSCWIHRAREVFDMPEGKEILHKLGIEGEYEGIGNLIVGYTDGDEPAARPRKSGYVYEI